MGGEPMAFLFGHGEPSIMAFFIATSCQPDFLNPEGKSFR
jgi:hypothetical protein